MERLRTDNVLKILKILKILRRIAAYVLRVGSLLLAVSVISFALVSASPVDPVQQYIMGIGPVSDEQRSEIEAYWGVDRPPAERYFSWLSALLHGDLGVSLLYRRPVAQIIAERFGNSLALMLCAWVFSGLIGYALGCVMGMNRDRWQDRCIRKICYLLGSVPTFWLGLVFLMVFAVMLGWFPVGFSVPVGMRDSEVTIWQRLHHLALPAFTLSLMSFSNIALHTRQKMIDVMNSEYVLFARPRGGQVDAVLAPRPAQYGSARGDTAVYLFCRALWRFCAGGECIFLSGARLGSLGGGTQFRCAAPAGDHTVFHAVCLRGKHGRRSAVRLY